MLDLSRKKTIVSAKGSTQIHRTKHGIIIIILSTAGYFGSVDLRTTHSDLFSYRLIFAIPVRWLLS
jgi:hypothetical protein